MALFVVSGPLKAQIPDEGREVEEHLTKSQKAAGVRLLMILQKNRAYPTIKSECLLLEFEEETKEHIQFAVRFDQAKCGGNSPSNLIDRFAVQKPSNSVVYYDPAGPRFKSFKWFLRNRNK